MNSVSGRKSCMKICQTPGLSPQTAARDFRTILDKKFALPFLKIVT